MESMDCDCVFTLGRLTKMNERITTGTGYLFPLTVDEDGNEVDYITGYCEYWRDQKPEDCKRWSLQVGENDEDWFETYEAALAAYMAK